MNARIDSPAWFLDVSNPESGECEDDEAAREAPRRAYVSPFMAARLGVYATIPDPLTG